ncbi:uncharacterized protein B0I36DRAFT_387577 [Microdochium trichocladiopsis]|uniref:Uncharacterized protein n=1 Tax=Microdochium trichocladiopsis TaxID=1682393 RepID=A0A9P8XV22_9PEZI|nr:uncharacterized protein B0I36DRAFT_387577 [Microdochium trichocladiopsis]KAH7020705.1 hypothetical protein B0I36DRAFT_387577 [Microdochium trichocladiopsis]
MVEESLNAIITDIQDDVADGLNNDVKLGTTVTMEEIIALVRDFYAVHVTSSFQSPEGPPALWREEIAFQYLISTEAEKEQEDLQRDLAQAQKNAAQELADFEAQYSKDRIEQSERLKMQRKELQEEKKETFDKRSAVVEESVKDLESRKLDKEAYLREIDRKAEAALKRWKSNF